MVLDMLDDAKKSVEHEELSYGERRTEQIRSVEEGQAYLEALVLPQLPLYRSAMVGAISTKPHHQVSDEATRPMLSIHFNYDGGIPSELFETVNSSGFVQIDQFYTKGEIVVFRLVYTGEVE